jgi:UDP-N-acetylmuramoyl-tripeptide--D-alanyl-D-alanine ligase
MDTLYELAQTTGGRILPKSRIAACCDVALGRIVSDSRQVLPGDVFWALSGANYQGDQFVEEAFRRGACGAVASRVESLPGECWAVCVDDTQRALTKWARRKRRKFTGIVVGVTGSVGKTTTRQMIHTVLQSRLKGTASPRNYNNHWGVPLSMMAIEPEHDYAVLELGASARGEIAALAELSAPKVGVITQLGDAHLSGFGSRQGVAEAKSELLAALPGSGQAVLADNPLLRSLAARCAAPITWIGVGPQCDLRAADVETGNGRLEFHVHCGNRTQPATGGRGSKKAVRFSIPVWGRHHIPAALSAIAVGRMLGFDLDEMAAALAGYQSVPMRCEVIDIRGAAIINDTYNSNPTAMRAALELLRDFESSGRRIVVCGDMAELGPQSIALHWQTGKEIVQIGGAELVIACGQFARHVTAGARAAGMQRARAIPCDTVEAALPYIRQILMPGDSVLVKGSRLMAMERVIEGLKAESAVRAPAVFPADDKIREPVVPVKKQPTRRRSA